MKQSIAEEIMKQIEDMSWPNMRDKGRGYKEYVNFLDNIRFEIEEERESKQTVWQFEDGSKCLRQANLYAQVDWIHLTHIKTEETSRDPSIARQFIANVKYFDSQSIDKDPLVRLEDKQRRKRMIKDTEKKAISEVITWTFEDGSNITLKEGQYLAY